jgi:hypothetical protein
MLNTAFTQQLKAEAGYGVTGVMMFLLATLTMVTSLSQLGSVSRGQLSAAAAKNTVAESILTRAWEAVEQDIQTKLTANITVNTSYTLTGSINTPNNPNDLSGSTSAQGTYAASVLQARGRMFQAQVTATVDGVTVTQKKMLHFPLSKSCAPLPSSFSSVTWTNLSQEFSAWSPTATPASASLSAMGLTLTDNCNRSAIQ